MNLISILLLAAVCVAFAIAARYVFRSGGKKSCCKNCDGICSCC